MVKNTKPVGTLVRGDIIKVSFDPIIGHEQSGYRPALVVSDRFFHKTTGFALCVPITSKKKGLLYEIEILGKEVIGVALIHGTRMLDLNARNFIYVEKATPDVHNKATIILSKIITE